jgi:hypothetical protein
MTDSTPNQIATSMFGLPSEISSISRLSLASPDDSVIESARAVALPNVRPWGAAAGLYRRFDTGRALPGPSIRIRDTEQITAHLAAIDRISERKSAIWLEMFGWPG